MQYLAQRYLEHKLVARPMMALDMIPLLAVHIDHRLTTRRKGLFAALSHKLATHMTGHHSQKRRRQDSLPLQVSHMD